MKALRKLSIGVGNLGIEEVPVPTINENQVLIEVKKAGVCGTDLHIFYDCFSKVCPPVTLGHEFSGVVVETGEKVSGWKIGERVTVESEAFSCGKCTYCRSGYTNLCPERLAYGYSVDGGFATFVAVRHTALHRLPDHMSFGEGAICEPLAVAVHAVLEKAQLKEKDRVLIIGPGPIGLLILKVAKTLGTSVFICGKERDKDRLDFAKYIGADSILFSENKNLEELIFNLTDGIGADVVFECSGATPAIKSSLTLVRRLGELILVGLCGIPIKADLDTIVFKEIHLKGSFGHNHLTWNKMIALLEQKKFDLKPFISGEFPLGEWQEAFQNSESGKGVKYLLSPYD